MNLENIEAFVHVMHYGSFNKAAEALYLSQPSVTARIQSLERELDCKLFDRNGKQVRITEEGKRFLPYAQQLMLTYRKGRQMLGSKRAVQGEARIGCTVSVSNYVIPRMMPYLRSRYPETTYKFFTGRTDEIVDKMLAGEIDIGFVRHVDHPNLKTEKFYEDPIRLYVYPGHPFQREEKVTVEAIAAEPLIFFECGSLDWLRIHRIFENLNRPPNILIQTDNSEMAKKLIVQKSGIAFLPGLTVEQEVSGKQLYPVAVPEIEGISLQTNLIYRYEEQNPLLEVMQQIGRDFRRSEPNNRGFALAK
jgi:DNA-binding transcriptional LysR family regulator